MPYYDKGTKEAILANVYTVLNTLAGDYKLNFLDYQRVEYSGIRIEDYPGIYINDMRIDKVRQLKDIVQNVFTIALVGFWWAADKSKLATEMNAFIEQVKDKIMADPTRDSNAYDTVIQTIATDGGTRSPQGQFIITLMIPFWSDE